MTVLRRAQRAATAALLIALAACGGEDVTEATSEPPQPDRAAPVTAEAREVECGGITFDLARLSGAPPASSLPEGPAGAVDDAGAPAFDPSLDWRIAVQSDQRVVLVRALAQPLDAGDGDIRTHQVRGLSLSTGASDVPDGWLLTSAGECTPRLVTDGDLEAAELRLGGPPSPAATTIDLLVHERECASGQPADGRIEVIELVETAEQVQLRVGVERPGGNQTCQGNPLTPFTVELGAPLGERQVVDASVVPPRPLTWGSTP